MTLRHLKIFLAICDYGNVTLASEKLHIAQPSVSLALNELEKYYGIKLFDRISRKLYLTEVGRQFLEQTRHIIDLLDDMEKGIKDWEEFGILRIGSSITIGNCLLPEYIKEFSQIFPNITIKVFIDNSDVIEKKVLANEVDFALIEGIPQNKQIISNDFMDDELVFVCDTKHPFCKQKQISPQDLANSSFILREKGSGTRELFDSVMLLHHLTITPIWESISTHAIINAVQLGLGVSVLPYRLLQEELKNKTLHHISIKDIVFKRKFYIIYHQNKYLSKSAQAFIKMCTTKNKSM